MNFERPVMQRRQQGVAGELSLVSMWYGPLLASSMLEGVPAQKEPSRQEGRGQG